MNDRELLELAAKAAGLPVGSASGAYQYRDDGIWVAGMYGTDNGYPLFWNPLIDDRDALRLAVHLHLMVHASSHSSSAQFYEMNGWATIEEPHGDANAATRRAITRAAAEIGARITTEDGK
ncbi:hypothetical protein [Burkholderia gladioli]|uniref:hypothetical protein n=1 Tax=Burkholderia gladioli TaxID=28095 RepID=UPI000BBD30D4|nr:hypothetical protein [Burkholderia gladioli]ATF87539.1 hypothetical protein CO712_20730 [Burkholderia gladioli pv. gladioli]